MSPQYAAAAQADSQFRAFAFLDGAGVVDGPGEVLAYGPVWGTGAAVVWWGEQTGEGVLMARAVGFIEAEGFVPVFDAVDAMVKATEVEVRGAVRLGGGLVAVAVTGDLATVEEAVEVGEEVARAVSGRAVKSIVFASPCLPVQALAGDMAMVGS